MTDLKQTLAELREKRLWPVAVVLVVALIAVPTLLAKSSSPPPVAQLPQSAASAASAATAVPAVSVETTPTNSNLKGHSRDPFIQQKLAAAAKPASTATSKPSAASTGTSTKSSSSAASGGGSAASGGSSMGGSAPLPRVLFYRFATSLRFGPLGDRLRTIKDVDKFTPLPSAKNPVVLFLGLRNDAKTAVFLLSSSASATGKGTCRPNRWSCDFLYLRVGQRELLLTQGALGHIAQYELDLTRIHPVPTSAPTGATASSTHVSSAGQRIFKRAAEFLPALRSIIYSTKTGLLSFTHRSAIRLVHVGRLALYPATAPRAAAGGGAM